MPRKRTGYDAACYYDGKLLGRCTKADSDAYTLLMNACGGDAARVLREYAYFSPELKAILEKAALMQADRSRTGGMFHAPKSSPWGEVQSCETLCPGVFLVSTASHGGTMVANEVAAVLSPAAKKCGFKDKGYICYEEDAQESVVLRELLDKKLWKIPDRIKDKGQFEEKLNQSIRQYHPNTGGQGRADERPPKLPAAQPRPKRPQDNLGSCWPEAIKEVYQNGLCASTKRPFQNQDKAGFQPNEAPACLFFQRGGGGPPGLPVFPWQYREQCRHVPDDRPHAPVLLSGYV